MFGLDYLAHRVFTFFRALVSVPDYGFAVLVLSLETLKANLP